VFQSKLGSLVLCSLITRADDILEWMNEWMIFIPITMHSYREDKYNIYTKTYKCRNTIFFITCYIVLLLVQTIFYNVVLKLCCFSGITTSLTKCIIFSTNQAANNPCIVFNNENVKFVENHKQWRRCHLKLINCVEIISRLGIINY
jgi:hypothetical protein